MKTFRNTRDIYIVFSIISGITVSKDQKNRSKHPEGFCKKGAFKNFAKITEIHLYRGLFFNKDSDWGPVILLQRNSGIGVFCEFGKIFKSVYFGNLCERLLLKSKIFANLFS